MGTKPDVDLEYGKGKGKPERGELRARLPPLVAHFLGHRNPSKPSPFPSLPLPVQVETILLSFIGSFTSIILVCAISVGLVPHFAHEDLPLVVGSMGATAILLYAAPEAPLSQPRNLVGGHVISAIWGICIRLLFQLSPAFNSSSTATISTRNAFAELTPVACALAVAGATSLMQLTKTIHPPGGATALLAIFQRSSHWAFLLVVFLSVVTMGAWACIIKNLGRRKYPAYWWTPIVPPKPAPAPTPAPVPASAPTPSLPKSSLSERREGGEQGWGESRAEDEGLRRLETNPLSDGPLNGER
ncbi:hypothetical protein T439DRAFT_326166 [Meredithblackwellia eburnea MCA 4105]